MRLAVCLRNWSLGATTASFLCAGAAWAQTNGQMQQNTQQQDTTQQQSWTLVGATARLQQKLDARNAHPGQEVRARLNSSVKAGGVRLDKGTELVGKIDQVQASTSGGPSMVSMVFNQARTKDGRSVAVKVTVIGAYPADEAQMSVNGEQTMPPAPRHVSSSERVDQQAGMLRNVSLHSAVENDDSATFRDEHGNLKLAAGTFLQVGIAPESGTNNGE